MSSFADALREEGRKEGRKEGRREGARNATLATSQSIAANLIAYGEMTLENIAKIVNLPLEKIQDMARNNSKHDLV